MHQIHLGSEADDELFELLCAEVRTLGGTIEDAEWVLGGSREATTYKIALPNGYLEAVANTQSGLLLRGEENLVSLLAEAVGANAQIHTFRDSKGNGSV